MMRYTYFLFLIACLFSVTLHAQVENTGMTDRYDTTDLGKFKVSGYVDTYYGFDFNQPSSFDRPYAVSSPRHNEVNINLVYADFRYQNSRVRARFIPGYGTYINSNYANEKGSLKNIIEANAGVKLSKTKNIWVDAGVMGSPYTNESAISKDHLMYTRAFAAEYAPYYLTGVRLTYPLSQKVTAYLYVLNGWQEISDVNNPLSFGSQLEWRPNKNLLINWNTYFGEESSTANPLYRMRYFTDLYAIYDAGGRFSFTTCAYIGLQNKLDTIENKKTGNVWWQANFVGKYKFSKTVSLAGRIEYYDDPKQVMIVPITGVKGFNTYSAGLCLNVKVTENALVRLESRTYFSEKEVYIDANGNHSKTDQLLIGNLTVWF